MNISNLIEFVKVSIFPPKEKDFNKSIFGINSFFNDPDSTIYADATDIKNALGVSAVRVLFDWNNDIQKSSTDNIFFGFIDDILATLPTGLDALIVVTSIPDWVTKNHRYEFITFFHKVVERYKNKNNIIGFQIWNEPNDTSNPLNKILGFDDPANYVEVVQIASDVMKAISGDKFLLVNAATTSIIQNYNSTIKYNESMLSSGIEKYIDVFAFHYYGLGYWNFLRPSGALDFLNKVNIPLWITELGSTSDKEKYARTRIPYLQSKLKNLKHIFWYQYSSAADSYGLIVRDGSKTLSDLFTYIMNR